MTEVVTSTEPHHPGEVIALPPLACRTYGVNPDNWKREIGSAELADYVAKGWTLHGPVGFVHPTSGAQTLEFVLVPPGAGAQRHVTLLNQLVVQGAVRAREARSTHRWLVALAVLVLLSQAVQIGLMVYGLLG